MRILRSPSKYIQGAGVLKNLPEALSDYGKTLFIVSRSGENRVRPLMEKKLNSTGMSYCFEYLSGECSQNAIDHFCEIIKREEIDIIVGIGGGKIIDAAKAASHFTNKPVAVVPTVASSDAACSALSILYHENGVFDRYLHLKTNPVLVMVDSNLILQAPTRLFVAGMGDALATYFEARAVKQSKSNNSSGGMPTIAAYTLAEKCYKKLLEDGPKARHDLEHNDCTEAVENIIEINTYVSSIGFESGGLAAAHAMHKGFMLLDEARNMYHGEIVAFCTLIQLVLENVEQEELETVIGFCKDVGLPTTLNELGMDDISESKLREISERVLEIGPTIHNMPGKITPENIYASIVGADTAGKNYNKRWI